jgi:acyl carrier protein
MPEDLAERVMGVIASTQHIEPEKISIDSTFQELNIDSLDGINILFAIENEFNISIPDEAARNIRTVREMVDGVRRLVEGRPGEAPAAAPA